VVTRCCQTCRWFRADADRTRGHCINPGLVAEVGLQLDVHQRELRCRTGWAVDRWEAANDDILLDIRWLNADRATDDFERISQPLSAGEIEEETEKDHHLASPYGFDSVIATDVMIDW
jgi:hypothetical protein